MRIGLLRDLAQLFDHVRRRRLIRIAHAQIDNILARRTRRVPHRIDLCDDIGGQALHSVKF